MQRRKTIALGVWCAESDRQEKCESATHTTNPSGLRLPLSPASNIDENALRQIRKTQDVIKHLAKADLRQLMELLSQLKRPEHSPISEIWQSVLCLIDRSIH